MQAGKMDRQITFQEFTVAANANGEEIRTYANLGTDPTVWAEVQTLKSSELYAAGQTLSMMDRVFITRYRSDVTAKMRVVYDGKDYDIVGYPIEIGRREGLRIIGKAVN